MTALRRQMEAAARARGLARPEALDDAALSWWLYDHPSEGEDKGMNQTESIRGMVTLLAVYREVMRTLLAIDSEDAGPLVDLVGLTGAALDDAERYIGTAEVRRIVTGARRGAAPHVAEIKADPPVKVADLKAERDAALARVAALEAALAPAWEAEEGATPGEWERVRDPYDDAPRVIADNCEIAVLTAQDGTAWLDAAFIAAAVNAVRAAREVK